MESNQVKKTVSLLFGVLAILGLLSFLPAFTIGNWKLRPIHILADIQEDPPSQPTPVVAMPDSLLTPRAVDQPDTCELSIPCIEDYSANRQALAKFFKALRNSRQQPVRIAFFGDSFIEGDILTAPLRDTLQQVFGGRGVGFVPIASEVAQYRTSILHQYNNWETRSIVGKYDDEPVFGTPGFVFTPGTDNWVEYKPGKGSRRFSSMQLFYNCSLEQPVTLAVNDTLHIAEVLTPEEGIQRLRIALPAASSVRMTLPADSAVFYGVSFEEGTGVYVDNFAMRGNSGMGLLRINQSMHRMFNQYRDYKLIILQYGLNVVGENDSTNYEGYARRMVTVIERLQTAFPESSILLVSISDRSSNQEGTFKTIPAIPMMRDAQRHMALKTGIAFWDLYEAMGGENSMVQYATATPTLAAKDYTHLTFRGGRIIAMKLAKALLHDQKRYENNRKPR